MFVTVHEKLRLCDNDPSDTVAVTVYDPALVYDGVPEIRPLVAFTDSPPANRLR